jgi:hypothetical protein
MRTNVINIKNHAVEFYCFSQIEIKYFVDTMLQKRSYFSFLRSYFYNICIGINLAVCKCKK